MAELASASRVQLIVDMYDFSVLHFTHVSPKWRKGRYMTTSDSTSSGRNKRLKFVELANKRVNRALKDLSLVANLANKRNYEYEDDEARKIIKALQSELDSVKHSFTSDSTSRSANFELKLSNDQENN